LPGRLCARLQPPIHDSARSSVLREEHSHHLCGRPGRQAGGFVRSFSFPAERSGLLCWRLRVAWLGPLRQSRGWTFPYSLHLGPFWSLSTYRSGRRDSRLPLRLYRDNGTSGSPVPVRSVFFPSRGLALLHRNRALCTVTQQRLMPGPQPSVWRGVWHSDSDGELYEREQIRRRRESSGRRRL
jgi:hypothetical protein